MAGPCINNQYFFPPFHFSYQTRKKTQSIFHPLTFPPYQMHSDCKLKLTKSLSPFVLNVILWWRILF